jgi:predicted RNA-binding Zn ribbon-like protein
LTTRDHDPHIAHFDTTLCLDFANADGWPLGEGMPERLANYWELVAWGYDAGVLTDAQANHLSEFATQHPTKVADVLQQASALHEAVSRIFTAVAYESAPESADLDVLNNMVIEAQAMRRLNYTAKGFVWEWLADRDRLDRMLWPVALSAIELLFSDRLVRVKQCAAETCGWLFLDTSRNRSRRWCDMSDCGNRAKARAYYERHRTESSDDDA